MAAQATQTENFQVLVGDISRTQVPRKFGSVISLFHVMSYLSNRNSQVQVFKNANNHLEMGGHFIFDVWFTPAVKKQVPELRIKRMADETIDVVRIAEPTMFDEHKNVEVNYTIFIREKLDAYFEMISESHLMHHFDESEISSLASEAGFETVKVEEFLTGKPAGAETWGVCFILKKVTNLTNL
jgi:predicted TPR repeat methyltransferase